MANEVTSKEAEYNELIELLKFTPRTYTIQVYGYGGDTRFIRTTKEQFLYFKEHEIDLEEYSGDWDNEAGVPEEFQPFPPGEPYEAVEMHCASGAYFDDDNMFEVHDEHSNTVLKSDFGSLDNLGIERDEIEEWYVHHDMNPGDVVIWHANGEKGTFFGGEIELTAPFNPKLLKFEYVDCDGTSYLSSITYNGEEIENNDYSSTGKWAETKWIVVGGNHALDLTDMEVSAKLRAEFMKKTEWFPVKVKPARVGLYECKFKADSKTAWPWSSSELVEWDGKKWDTDKKVGEWRGLLEQIVE
jgi:hypothetical protein